MNFTTIKQSLNGSLMKQCQPYDFLAIARDDIRDTGDNTVSVLKAIDDFEDLYDNLANDPEMFIDYYVMDSLWDRLPISFNLDDQQFQLYRIDVSCTVHGMPYNDTPAIGIKQILNDDAIIVGRLNQFRDHELLNFDWNLIDSTFVTKSNETYDLFDTVTLKLGEAYASMQILQTAAETGMNNVENKTLESLSAFRASAESYVADSNSEASQLFMDISNMIARTGGNVEGFRQIINSYYQGFTSLTMGSNGKISFNNKKYTVQSFYGKNKLRDIAYNVIQPVFQALTTAVGGVLGALVYAGVGIISLIKSVYSEVSDTKCSINFDTNSRLFAVPVLQGSVNISDLSGGYTAFISDLIDNGGVCTMMFNEMQVMCWIDLENDQINFEGYVNLSWSYHYLRFCNYISSTSYSKVLLGTSERNLSDIIDNGFPIYDVGYYDNDSNYHYTGICVSKSDLDTPGVYSLRSTAGNPTDNQVINYNYDDYVGQCTTEFDVCQYIMDQDLSTSDMDLLFRRAILINMQFFFGRIKVNTNGDTTLSLSGNHIVNPPSWSNLINTVIPNYKSYTTNLSLLTKMLDAISVVNNTTNLYSVPVGWCPIDRSNWFVIPPKYSKNAARNTLWLAIGGLVATAAVTATVISVRSAIKRKMSKSYLSVQAKQSAYSEALTATDESGQPVYSKSELNAMYKDYYKSLKKYNKLSTITSQSKLSYISGWELGDSSGASGTSGLSAVKELTTTYDAIRNLNTKTSSDQETLVECLQNISEVLNQIKDLIK